MISPLEIKKHEFSRTMRGYDMVEVRTFLESIAEEYEKILDQQRNSTGELERLRAELGSYQRMEQNMREAMVNAQETLRDAREGAKRDADLIHREAELMAEKIILEARKKGDAIRHELDALVERRNHLARKLKALLRSELELIEMLTDFEDEEVASPQPKQPSAKAEKTEKQEQD